MSIFDGDSIRQPDYYTEHLKKTLDWVHEKQRDVEERIRSGTYMGHPGYRCEINVEARWLEQLICELIGKHQIILEAQKTANQLMSYMSFSRPIVVEKPEVK